MLDERRETRDVRCFELSSRTPFRDRLWKSFRRPVGSIGFFAVLIALVLFSACTDYESMIEGDFESLMLDSRDGQVYDTVTIGAQTWMAQNLNYETPNSFCYKDNPKNCAKYGRLYSWDAAMVACPAGWHLPSLDEWNELFNVVGVTGSAGNVLKSTSGWDEDGNGTDAFGFNVLPAGSRGYEGISSSGEGTSAHFWSSTESISNNQAETVGFYSDEERVFSGSTIYPLKYSVRCVKD